MSSQHVCHQDLIQRRYANAIALNNMGIELLVKQCYHQAFETLQDATSLMQSIFSNPHITTSGQDEVHRAMDCLANLMPEKELMIVFEILTWRRDGTLQCEDSMSVLQTVLGSAPSSSVAFPMLLEETFMHSQVTRQASLVTHNLGIACLCCLENNPSSEDFRINARDFSQAASAVLMRQPDLESVEWYCLAMAVLNSFIRNLQECQQHDEAAEFYEVLVRLRNGVCVLEEGCDLTASAPSNHFCRLPVDGTVP